MEKGNRLLGPRPRREGVMVQAHASDGLAPALSGADPHDLFKGHDEDLPVTHGVGPSALDDGLDRLLDVGLVDTDGEPRFRDSAQAHLAAATLSTVRR